MRIINGICSALSVMYIALNSHKIYFNWGYEAKKHYENEPQSLLRNQFGVHVIISAGSKKPLSKVISII